MGDADVERTEESSSRSTRERVLQFGFSPPGEVLHRLRSQRGMSLRQVSAECGLSVSFLAALERGETDIALERLARLAHVFGHDVGSFLGFSRRDAGATVFRREKIRTLLRAPGVRYRVLDVPHTGYQVIQTEFDPGCGVPEDIQHEGVDLLVVTAGTLTLRNRDQSYELREGDCGFWLAGNPHSFENVGLEVAKAVFFLDTGLYQ
ncbi:helix-turn-helix domain-containing protein [Streptomyces achromogenes]|uniref:helix-turn-helix domain-containing protein n=1 Tax=Streptomyces achromogenes TaxID=67255 RepID=UPI0036F85575